MKRNLIVLGLLTSVFFANAVYACDMPEMKDHSKPCPVQDKKIITKEKTVQKKSDISTKAKKIITKSNQQHKH